jgi:hypothetical protein
MLKGLGWLITALASASAARTGFSSCIESLICAVPGHGVRPPRRAYDSAALRRTKDAVSRRSFGSLATRKMLVARVLLLASFRKHL